MELIGLLFVIPFIGFIIWVCLEGATGVRHVHKTLKAVDKWSDDQLEK